MKIHKFEIVTEISDTEDYHEHIYYSEVWFPKSIHRPNFTKI